MVGTEIATAGVVACLATPLAVSLAWTLLRLGLSVESGVFSKTAAPAITEHVMLTTWIVSGIVSVCAVLPASVATIRQSGRMRANTTPPIRRRTERIAAVLQVALVFAIGAQAVTFAVLLHRIARENVGLTNTGLIVASVQTDDRVDVDDPRVRLARYEAVVADLGRRGILAAFTHTFPLTSSDYQTTFGERTSRSAQRPMLRTRLVTPSYFDVTRTRATSGRVLTTADAGLRRAVVNDVYAATRGGANAVLGSSIGPNGRWTVVGVVPAVRQVDFYEQAQPEAYVLYDDFITLRSTSSAAALTSDYLVADARGDVQATLAAMRQSLAAEAPEVMIDQTSSLDDLIDLRLGAKRLVAAGAITFAVIALVLAAIGLHAMVSHGLALRRREIGIRLALGATPRRIAVESATPIIVTSAAGLAAGVAILLIERVLLHAALLPPPGVTAPSLTGVTVLSAAVLLASLAVACYRPVRHASEVDPAIVLRGE
jgi:hypothetical protein